VRTLSGNKSIATDESRSMIKCFDFKSSYSQFVAGSWWRQRLQGCPLKDDEFAGLIGQNVIVVIERRKPKGQKLVAIDQGVLESR
jgi:hypothetical protein